MKASVVEILSKALAGENVAEPPRFPVQPEDRYLGKLKSSIVPSLLRVLGYFGPEATSPHADPDILIGLDGVSFLMKSELVRQYGSEIRPDEEPTVRWEGDWVVVAISRAVLAKLVGDVAEN